MGVLQACSESYYNHMVEAILLVECLLVKSIASWDRSRNNALWFRFCKGLWDCKGNNFE